MGRKDDKQKQGRKTNGRKPTPKRTDRGFTWPEPPAKGRAREPPRQPWHSAGPAFIRPAPRRDPAKPPTQTLKGPHPEEAP